MAELSCRFKPLFSFLRCNRLIFECSTSNIVYRKRKPIYFPTAKSKVFRILGHPYVPPDEVELTENLNAEYDRRIASLGEMFKKELEKTSDVGILAKIKAEAQEKEFRELLELNKQENEKVKVIREETFEHEFQEKISNWMQQCEDMEREKEEKRKQFEEYIEEVKKESVSYVTPETLEQAIEHALDNPVNYNFCIDLNGNILWEGEAAEEKSEIITESSSASVIQG